MWQPPKLLNQPSHVTVGANSTSDATQAWSWKVCCKGNKCSNYSKNIFPPTWWFPWVMSTFPRCGYLKPAILKQQHSTYNVKLRCIQITIFAQEKQ